MNDILEGLKGLHEDSDEVLQPWAELLWRMPFQDGAGTPELHVCLQYPSSAEFNTCCLRPTVEGFFSCSYGEEFPTACVDLREIVGPAWTTGSVQTHVGASAQETILDEVDGGLLH